MKMTSNSRITLVWMILVLGTVGSWLISVGPTDSAVSSRLTPEALILLVAGVKIWLVMDWFMELREAAALVRLGARLWLISLLAVLLVVTAQG